MLASVPASCPVVVVDNASQHEDAAAVKDLVEQRNGQFLVNVENLGFGVACNQGAELAKTEFLLFLNPDSVLDATAIDALVAAADRNPDAVAFNPRISNANGSPYFKRSSRLLPRDTYLPKGWPEADCLVPVLTGAAFFVRRMAFEAVGGFDPKIFLYHEDDDLSLRMKESQGTLMFVHDARVTHQSGHSTLRSPETAAFKAFHMGRSRVYATSKHAVEKEPGKAVREGVMALLSPENLISKRRRRKNVSFLKGVLSEVSNSRDD